MTAGMFHPVCLHDALPIFYARDGQVVARPRADADEDGVVALRDQVIDGEVAPELHVPDRKSTRLNSSHGYISYAVFCLTKKNILTDAASPRAPLLASPSSG